MRHPEYLSPTSMAKWRHDPNGYYLKYLSDTPPPREPQNLAMAVGSAFDAYVKSFLHEAIFGKGADATFERDAIFEAQVEPQNRDQAKVAGDFLLGKYRQLGSLDHLMQLLGKSIGKPRFEMDVRGVISSGRVGAVRGVPFRVKPDLFFVSEQDAHVIFDWKVNGYTSSSGASPMKGYVRLRDGVRPQGHAEAKIDYFKGIAVNVAKGVEAYNEEWAAQLSVGSWACGEEVGSKFVAVVHQIVCRPGSVRVAEHASFVARAWQEQLHKEASEMWAAINDVVHAPGCCAPCQCKPHVFRFLSKTESDELCKLLDKRKDVNVDELGSFSPMLSDAENEASNVKLPQSDGWFTPTLE